MPNGDLIVPSSLIKLIRTRPSGCLQVPRYSSALLPYGAPGDAVKMWDVCWGDCSLIWMIFRAIVAYLIAAYTNGCFLGSAVVRIAKSSNSLPPRSKEKYIEVRHWSVAGRP